MQGMLYKAPPIKLKEIDLFFPYNNRRNFGYVLIFFKILRKWMVYNKPKILMMIPVTFSIAVNINNFKHHLFSGCF